MYVSEGPRNSGKWSGEYEHFSLPSFDQLCQMIRQSPTPLAQEASAPIYSSDEKTELHQPPVIKRRASDQAFVRDFGCVKGYVPTIKIDPNNQWEQWLWNELEGKPLSWWIKQHCTRDPKRVPYGAKPSSKRARLTSHARPHSRQLSRLDSRDRGQISKENHAQKEQDRRDRHRRMQCESDTNCSDFHFSLARQRLTETKRMFGHSPLYNKPNPSRDTGKDEQLLATVFQQKMSFWIIQAQQQLIEQLSTFVESEVESSVDPSPEPVKRPKRLAYRSKL